MYLDCFEVYIPKPICNARGTLVTTTINKQNDVLKIKTPFAEY